MRVTASHRQKGQHKIDEAANPHGTDLLQLIERCRLIGKGAQVLTNHAIIIRACLNALDINGLDEQLSEQRPDIRIRNVAIDEFPAHELCGDARESQRYAQRQLFTLPRYERLIGRKHLADRFTYGADPYAPVHIQAMAVVLEHAKRNALIDGTEEIVDEG